MSKHEWKVGDRVLVSRGGFGSFEKIDVVKKITPSGNVKVGEALFRPNGWQKGGDTWHHMSIELLTPELEAEFKARQRKEHLIKVIKSCKWEDAPIAALEAVYAIVKEKS